MRKTSKYITMKGASFIAQLDDTTHLSFMQEIHAAMLDGLDDALKAKFAECIQNELSNVKQVRKNHHRTSLKNIVREIKAVKVALFKSLEAHILQSHDADAKVIFEDRTIIRHGDTVPTILSNVKSFLVKYRTMPTNSTQSLLDNLRSLMVQADSIISEMVKQDAKISNFEKQFDKRWDTDRILSLIITKFDNELHIGEVFQNSDVQRLDSLRNFLGTFDRVKRSVKLSAVNSGSRDNLAAAV